MTRITRLVHRQLRIEKNWGFTLIYKKKFENLLFIEAPDKKKFLKVLKAV